jgi:hypothetical protein
MSRGRVYSLDGKKAQTNEDLIGGMCFLGQNPVRFCLIVVQLVLLFLSYVLKLFSYLFHH